MKVYAVATLRMGAPWPMALYNMRLYASKAKAQANLRGNEGIVELGVDEYPDTTELSNWLNASITPQNTDSILALLKRADKYKLYWEVVESAFERQNEPDFEIVAALDDACFRWDV